ncbi:hypothetical protein [Planktotalea sp.]|uniref:hypothetical protein n=1 Tax=Planktotalea sp. TaxID=2029877 RepID=UPI003D6BDC74
MTDLGLYEFQQSQAKRALELSEGLCQGGWVDLENCGWYHGSWTLLRVLGLVSNPYWHFQFFSSRVAKLNAQDNALVLACADASMAHLVLLQSDCYLTVADICDTPLVLSKELAEELGRDITCQKMDILNGSIDRRFELIVTDAFLTRFRSIEKMRVLSNVSSLLQPNGRFVTTVRMGGKINDADGYMSGGDRKRWFVERAIARFNELGGVPGFEETIVKELAQNYMRSMESYRFSDLSEIKYFLKAAELKLLEYEEVIVPGESEESIYLRMEIGK